MYEREEKNWKEEGGRERERGLGPTVLTKPNQYSLFLPLLSKLILLVDTVMVIGLCKLHNLRSSEVHPIIQVTKEEEVVELVCQVKLSQLFLFEVSHPLQNVVVVLVASAKKLGYADESYRLV